ncbi:MAG: hypothetical protein ACFWT2_12020 [Thermoanaerobacterium thermosaccharolyticum]|jgi:di/tripeptidase
MHAENRHRRRQRKSKITQKKGLSVRAKYKLKGRYRKGTDKCRNRLILARIKKAAKKVRLKPIAGVSQDGTKSGEIKGRGKAEIG